MQLMSSEEIAAFLAAIKKVRDDLDDFNRQLVAINGAGGRLGLLCEETAAACPAAVAWPAQILSGAAQDFRGFSDRTSQVLMNFQQIADTVERTAGLLEVESRKVTH